MSKKTASENESSRRSFLVILSGFFMALIGGVMGVASGIYAIFPAFNKKASKDLSWKSLELIDKIPDGISKHSIISNKQTGWAISQTEQIVWVVKEKESVNVFSAVCPHEGCTVNHQSSKFICLCHMSQWKLDGTKTDGPTPRDLDKLDHRISDNKLEVNYQNFKPGTPEKTPLA